MLAAFLLAATPLLRADQPAPDWSPILPTTGPAGDGTRSSAERMLRDTFTLQGVQGVARRRPDGGLDWEYRGPRHDPEWAWFFNRHSYFVPLYKTYLRTHDDRYADYIFTTLDDWIMRHPTPGGLTFSAAWRPLEAARRILDSWTLVYLKLGNHPAFTPERRAHFLESIRAHGEQLRHHHALYGNHLITEMLALAQLSLVFPRGPETDEWLRYSLEQLRQNYSDQVYPDGSYKELSSHYQRVVAIDYQHLLTLLETSGRNDLADTWRPQVRRLWAYFAAVMKPNGDNPLNNDSDQETVADLLRPYAPDLIAGDPASRWLPYAGQAVFRSENQGSTQWAFFDVGPRGTEHDHTDRLHLSVSLGEYDFLVDNGRYTYKPGPWRDYFEGPSGHNVVLFNGTGSDQGPHQVTAPETTGRFITANGTELACGDTTFATAANPRAADWRRLVIHLEHHGWLVIDRLVTFAPANLTTLWHWAPDCDVSPTGTSAQLARNGSAALGLRLVSSESAGRWQDVRGADQPVQGWHSDRFNSKTPATCTLYDQQTTRPVTNVWLLAPGAEAPSALDVTFARDGRLTILVKQDTYTRRLHLDPEHPETLVIDTGVNP